MNIENFTKNLGKMFPRKKNIIYEDYIKDNEIEIINNPDYSKIFTNYNQVCEWFNL